MDKDDKKELVKIRRLLEILVKQTAPEKGDDLKAQLSALSEDKPKSLYDGADAFLRR